MVWYYEIHFCNAPDFIGKAQFEKVCSLVLFNSLLVLGTKETSFNHKELAVYQLMSF